MRIAMLGRYYNLQGGVSRCLAELSTRCARYHQTTVYTHECLDVPPIGGPLFHTLPMATRPFCLQGPTFAIAAAYTVHRSDFDVVHAHGPQVPGADVYTAHSVHAAWLRQKRHTSGTRGTLSRIYPPHIAQLALERLTTRDDHTRIIAISRVVQRELVETLDISPSRIEIIYNGVDTERFRPAEGKTPNSSPLLAFVGYEFERKGLECILRAMPLVGDSTLRLLVAGGAPRGPYERLTFELGLEDRVQFLGHVPAVERVLQQADVLVFPTEYEPFGLVILESLSCGVPVITAATAGAAELMLDGQEGYLLQNPKDPSELAATLNKWLNDRARWPSMARAARSVAMQHNWDNVWSRTEKVYEKVRRAKLSQGKIV